MDAKLPQPAGFSGPWEVGDPRFLYSEGAGPFRLVPKAVAVPVDESDLACLLEFSRTEGIPLTPRGAGSAIPGGNIGTGIIVDMGRFNHRARFVSEGSIRAGASVTLDEINELALTRGMRVATDPSSGSFCTIGGMVNTNAAGPRSFSKGPVRDWVRSVGLVTADGSTGFLNKAADSKHKPVISFREHVAPDIHRHSSLIADRFPKTRKNTAGYALDAFVGSNDVLDIIIGSEGSLGFVTEVEIGVEPVPTHSGTSLLLLNDLERLTRAVQLVSQASPVSIELLTRSLLRYSNRSMVPDAVEGALIVTIERDDRAQMEDANNLIDKAARDLSAELVAARTAEEISKIWAIRKSASSRLAHLPASRRSLQVVEDGCVPVSRLSEYLGGVSESARDNAIEFVAFGHAGDGHLHVNALPDTESDEFEQRLERFKETVTELQLSLGGTTAGEHGDGLLRTPYLQRLYGSEIVSLFRDIKQCFDPLGILNPGVKVPVAGAGRPTLKVGNGAPPIPADCEAELRSREREGGWRTWTT